VSFSYFVVEVISGKFLLVPQVGISYKSGLTRAVVRSSTGTHFTGSMIQPMFKTLFVLSLAIISSFYVVAWALIARKNRRPVQAKDSAALEPVVPTPFQAFIGFFANFLDTLGIGSFATTTSIFKLGRMVRDEQVPGTLNVGHALPTITEACIYITIVQVDLRTLLIMIAAAVLGSWFGAGIVSRWPRRNIQIGMGLALLSLASLMLMSMFKLLPLGGENLGLNGILLGAGALGNFALGALMTIGIGLYAPCMVLVYMLGMQPLAAFPIMMGSCAFLMPIGSVQFIRNNRYNLRAALGLTLGGIPGVLLAAYLVKSLPLDYVRWLVVIVVLFTATRMLHSARVEKAGALATEVAE
jgi:uncharacterized membrane protein YfcA